ncbi:Dymeclin [Lamellibrachia satsuma]|nr:Dymeclin [Lamellibrachia satsuma]
MMGANSSSLSELSANETLLRLAGSECITANDPFWNQLLSFSFSVPRTSADQRLLEESTSIICKNFAINNCQTGNFGSLIRVFLGRASELKASSQCDDSIFMWQTYNALFIIRNVCKYFVENLSEEVVLQQFDTQSPGAQGGDSAKVESDVLEDFVSCLMEIVVDVPVSDTTYRMHYECLNMLLVLLSMQMFATQSATDSHIYRMFMQGKCSIHACVFMKTLVQRFIEQQQCPVNMQETNNSHGALYGITSSVASSLWTVMTLGLANKAAQVETAELVSDKLLAKQSLLLILVLANHCTSDLELHNPYRQALFSFTDSQDSAPASSPTLAVATFKVNFSKLYETMCATLKEDQTTLLLYLLLHRNLAMKAFILSRTSMDSLVMPILHILYAAQERNSHHIYMALIVLLILSEDDNFNKAVHETVLKNVTWFKERQISEITLGGMLILVVIRTIQYNMTKMRDKYLHTNCLAVLANMSAQFHGLHPYVSQRIVSLFALLLKKHSKLVEQIRQSAMDESSATKENNTATDPDTDYVEDLNVLEEVIRMVLEIINSCLCHTLHHNPNLVYTLLYQRALFAHFRTHPTFQDIIQNIDTVLSFFSTKLDQLENLSVPEVLAVVKEGATQFRRDRLKKFPDLKFKYVEEDEPEEFFSPYVWSLVYHASTLYFNASRIQIFALQPTS